MGNINDFGFPFTSIGGDREYSALEWRDYFSAFTISGIVTNLWNELKVNPQGSPNKTVYVDTGAALLEGAMRIMSGTTNLTIADNSSGNPRIDRIVARLNYTDRKIEFAVKQGTPAASPAAPTLTRDATAYEVSLAKIAVANGFTTIVAENITDERADVTVCGAANFALGVIPPSGMEAGSVVLPSDILNLYALDINKRLSDALIKAHPKQSYIAFCGNVNTNSIDAAMGKNNEDMISCLGIQLAMYAWFNGTSKVSSPFNNLTKYDTLDEIIADPVAFKEACVNSYIADLLSLSSYVEGKTFSTYSDLVGVSLTSDTGTIGGGTITHYVPATDGKVGFNVSSTANYAVDMKTAQSINISAKDVLIIKGENIFGGGTTVGQLAMSVNGVTTGSIPITSSSDGSVFKIVPLKPLKDAGNTAVTINWLGRTGSMSGNVTRGSVIDVFAL